MLKAFSPESRITAMAEIPCAVASATIVSSIRELHTCKIVSNQLTGTANSYRSNGI